MVGLNSCTFNCHIHDIIEAPMQKNEKELVIREYKVEFLDCGKVRENNQAPTSKSINGSIMLGGA